MYGKFYCMIDLHIYSLIPSSHYGVQSLVKRVVGRSDYI